MIRVKVFFTVLICISLIAGCEMINIEQNNSNIDFCKYNNLQEVYYEYGQNNNRKKYKYNLITSTTKEDDVLRNIASENETFIDEEAGDEYCFSYHMSKYNIRVNDGIRHINKRKNIDELLWSSSYLAKKYNKKAIGLKKLTYEKKNGNLYFYFNIDGVSVLSKISINNQFDEIIKYKPIKHLLWFDSDYLLVDNRIFIIDIDSQICIYDILNEKLVNTNCFAYNFALSDEGNTIYYVGLDNNICRYDIKEDTQKILFKLKSKRVEWIDIDKSNKFLVLVESLDKYCWFGPDTSQNFKQNELNLYEISTGNKTTVKKQSLFNVIFEAHFVD